MVPRCLIPAGDDQSLAMLKSVPLGARTRIGLPQAWETTKRDGGVRAAANGALCSRATKRVI